MNNYHRPTTLEGRTLKLPTGHCGSFFLTLNEDGGKLVEVIMRIGKSGNCIRSQFQLIGLLFSVILQSDISREKIKKILLDYAIESNCGNKIIYQGEEYHSCIDYTVQKIIEEMASREEIKIEEEV